MHAFLEQWGLINYQVDYEARAAPLGPPCTSHFTVLADTPSGLAPITGPRPTTGPSATKQMIEFKSKTSTVTTTLKPGEENKDPAIEKLNIDNFGLNTKIEKKQSLTMAGGNGLSIMRSHEWSDSELLLLLEGLELYKDDWNKVCEHVGSRTQDECILKFLQLPIEDPYLDPNSSQFNSSLGPLAYQPIPFSQSGNPVMSTVAFLASMVDPRIASAAAKAAIAEFTKMKDEVPPQILDSHISNVVQALKDGKKVDANYNIEQTGVAIVPEASKSETLVNGDNNVKEVKDKEEKKEEENKQQTTTVNEEKKSPEQSSESSVIKQSDQSISAMDVDSPVTKSAENTKNEEDKKEDSNIEEKIEPVKSEESEKTITLTTTTTTTVSTTTTMTASITSAQGKEAPATISEVELKNAAASALAAAAVKARQLALNEEKKIKSTVSLLVETQLKKLEIKLRHFEELEAIMDRERENVKINFFILFNFRVYW